PASCKPSLDAIRHEDGIDVLAAALVVRLAIPLVDKAERPVKGDRRPVPRKHVQLELAHPRFARPGDRLLEQSPPDPPATVTERAHQTQIGHMATRRMGIARDREATDDNAAV